MHKCWFFLMAFFFAASAESSLSLSFEGFLETPVIELIEHVELCAPKCNHDKHQAIVEFYTDFMGLTQEKWWESKEKVSLYEQSEGELETFFDFIIGESAVQDLELIGQVLRKCKKKEVVNLSAKVTAQNSYVECTQKPLQLSKHGEENGENHVSHMKNEQLRFFAIIFASAILKNYCFWR